eukprot:scaffold54805_cov52-Prasinocladus_malaysianus.AAC.1
MLSRFVKGATLLIALASVDYSSFSTRSAEFLLNNGVAINDVCNQVLPDSEIADILADIATIKCAAIASSATNHTLVLLMQRSKNNALLAALATFPRLEPVTACICCTIFEEDIRKQNCMELMVFLVERGINLEYERGGVTALLVSLDQFITEAVSPKMPSMSKGCCIAAVADAFDAKTAFWAITLQMAYKMENLDCQSERPSFNITEKHQCRCFTLAKAQ